MIYRLPSSDELLLFSIVDQSDFKNASLKEFAIFSGFQAIEIIVFAFNFLSSPILLTVMYRSAVFHRNLTCILLYFLTHYQLSQFSRLILLMYQYEIFLAKGDMEAIWPVIACSFHRIFMYIMYIATTNCIILERCYATYYLCDYERKRRRWISFQLVFIASLGSTVLAYLYMWKGVAYVVYIVSYALPLTILCSSSTCSVFLYLYRHNHRRLRKLKQSYEQRHYSLSLRFQLEENVKALQLIRNIVAFSTVGNIFGISLFATPFLFYSIHDVERTLFAAAFETFAAVYGLSLSILVLYSIPPWLRDFLRILQAIYFLCTPRRVNAGTRRRSELRRNKVNIAMPSDEEATVYFTQLTDMWK